MYKLIRSLMINNRFYAALSMVEKVVDQSVEKLDCEILFFLETLNSEFTGSSLKVDSYCCSKIEIILQEIPNKVLVGDFSYLCRKLTDKKKKIELDIVKKFVGLEDNLNSLELVLKNRVFVLLGEAFKADISDLNIDQVRDFSKYLDSLGEHELACDVVDIVLKRMHSPFWDWLFKGEQFEKLNDLSSALECFNNFLQVAIDKQNSQAIQTGLSKAIKCQILTDLNQSKIDTLIASLPDNIDFNDQVSKLLKEASEILEFRRLNTINNTDKRKSLGYSYFSENDINDFINNKLEVIKVNPTYSSFYELSKAYAAIGNIKLAKKYLKTACDLNVFLFTNYTRFGMQAKNG
ncbi:hypothetical protein Q4567_00120 [Aliiglaciecola sp. 2_MG-2023]|uniref:tetratricopeptide repeat protein n=1 Tax=unclassified Aliiglaciecola TaxID=2593648 RepID=UPI0026E483FC|nr:MULTISPECIES: hypothetical protein [unclassified Aliiglaciecola]MDO6709112.1 hypothetical protein [Aliiglaciecola sp. 2_MG-2023]MDO6750260.1 hypothetical protein [Aliiglaciecola sp. 1_MG-2023]